MYINPLPLLLLKVKEVDLYSAFIVVSHTQGAQVRITQCYLQITPYLPFSLLKYVERRNHYCNWHENSERKDRIWTSLVQCHECQIERNECQTKTPRKLSPMVGVCKKTTGPTGGRWVGKWRVGPKGGIAGVSLSRPLQTTGQHSGVQLFNSQSFDPNLNSSQLQQSRLIQIKQCAA